MATVGVKGLKNTHHPHPLLSLPLLLNYCALVQLSAQFMSVCLSVRHVVV